MSRQRTAWNLLLSCLCALLAACQPADTQVASGAVRQHVVEWPEQRLLFIADSRAGRVQAFHLGHGAPVPLAQAPGHARAVVRDLQLDERTGQLWVLGDDGVSVYDARDLALQKHIPLATGKMATLRIESAGVGLIDAAGVLLDVIARESSAG